MVIYGYLCTDISKQSDFDVQQKYNFDIQRPQVRLKDQHWNPTT